MDEDVDLPVFRPARILTALFVAVFTLGVLAAGAWYYQDEVGLWVINPDRSYEAYTPPAPPDYDDPDTWLARGEGNGPADVFFIHANVYHGDGGWNAPYNRDTQLPWIKDVLLPLEAGPFAAQGRLWAPRYREPTLAARFTQKHPGEAARDTAYRDVEQAFLAFLRERDPQKPFIVAGYGDGALFAGKLWSERIGVNPVLRQKVIALYAIGMPLPAKMFDGDVCQGEEEARCLLAFTPIDARFEVHQARLRESTLTLGEDGGWVSSGSVGKLCAPPPFSDQVQAAFVPAPEDDTAAPDVMQLPTRLDASCEGGLLIVTPPDDPRLRTFRFFGKQWRPDNINLFYEPLAKDVAARLTGGLRLMAKEANTAPPMMAPIEVQPSEINKIPEEPVG